MASRNFSFLNCFFVWLLSAGLKHFFSLYAESDLLSRPWHLSWSRMRSFLYIVLDYEFWYNPAVGKVVTTLGRTPVKLSDMRFRDPHDPRAGRCRISGPSYDTWSLFDFDWQTSQGHHSQCLQTLLKNLIFQHLVPVVFPLVCFGVVVYVALWLLLSLLLLSSSYHCLILVVSLTICSISFPPPLSVSVYASSPFLYLYFCAGVRAFLINNLSLCIYIFTQLFAAVDCLVAIVTASNNDSSANGSHAASFASVWTLFMVLAVSVSGTIILRRVRANFDQLMRSLCLHWQATVFGKYFVRMSPMAFIYSLMQNETWLRFTSCW